MTRKISLNIMIEWTLMPGWLIMVCPLSILVCIVYMYVYYIYIYSLYTHTYIYIYVCVCVCGISLCAYKTAWNVYLYIYIYIYMYDPNHELGLVVRRSVLRVFQEAFQYSSMVEHWIFLLSYTHWQWCFFLAGLECRNWLSYGFLLWTR